jgi:hypothetical protein
MKEKSLALILFLNAPKPHFVGNAQQTKKYIYIKKIKNKKSMTILATSFKHFSDSPVTQF